MKKKLIALLCVTAVVMGMTACGSDSKENKKEAKGEEKKTIRLAAGDPCLLYTSCRPYFRTSGVWYLESVSVGRRKVSGISCGKHTNEVQRRL